MTGTSRSIGPSARCVRGRLASAVLAIALLLFPTVATGQPTAYEELQTFSAVLNHVRMNYIDSVTYRHLVRAAIGGVLRSLDPHSQFIPRNQFRRLSAYRRGDLAGIGIRVEGIEGFPTVLTVLRDSPAARARIRPGDRLIEVDDTSTAGLSIAELELQLSGDEGSKVRLKLARGSRLEPDTFRVTLKRDRLEWLSVAAQAMVDTITGYVRLEEFGPESREELKDALKDLRRSGAERAILDLRGNPGGLIDAAVDVASLFLRDESLVFRSRGRKADTNQDYLTRETGEFVDLPLIVLVDHGSASAAEAVAGSLQDHDRALLVGQRTFGKGLIQSPFFLPTGDVVSLTIARVVSPSGRVIQRPYGGLTSGQYRAFAGAEGTADTSVYRTTAGRPVRGGGGIEPDVHLPDSPRFPVWWSIAADSGFDLAVADSVAYTLPGDGLEASGLLSPPEEWMAAFLSPFLERIRSRLGVRAEVDPALQAVIALQLAARAAEVRWGADARERLEVRHDPAISTALDHFPRLEGLLAGPRSEGGPWSGH